MFLGEIGLTGEVRSVSQLEVRLKEGVKLGFDEFYLPEYQKKLASEFLGNKARLIPLRTVDDLRKSLIIKKVSGNKTDPRRGNAYAAEDRSSTRAPEFEGG
jgi:hypothetical protein